MARKVFFSFHYERDAWRAGQVRNSNITQEIKGYLDAAEWEEVKKKGDKSIKDWIAEQLKGTSVTVVLIGKETSNRKWVKYEIEESLKKGNKLLGIYIHRLKNQKGEKDTRGDNPLDNYYVEVDGKTKKASNVFKTYFWDLDNGYDNFSDWIEEAAEISYK
ncbi:TIR domain-containing protein [Alkalihalobacillus oceani]|uniref:TIR domain-containing protein n=1 Tax=Halalkalibacter oceani TaxID=1653776 RepID=UPI00203E969B|nr:TIR domain-containing protein [Halalkalibacter oceani]MCM3762821.1 TIR domain-containing protein [Halalkalibacter oceani]